MTRPTGNDAGSTPATDEVEPRWLTDEEQLLWRTWLQATKELSTHLERQLQGESALSLPDYEVLVTLSEYEGPGMRISELADSMQWERSRVSHHLSRMEKRQLVARVDCRADGRGQLVTVTPIGVRHLTEAAPGHVEAVRHYLLDALTARDRVALQRSLDRVLKRIRQEEAKGRRGA